MEEDPAEPDRLRTIFERYGLPASIIDLPAIRVELEDESKLGWDNDPEVLRLLCAQLFSIGLVEDCLPIWRAKSSNFDAMCGIDVQLLCGAGLEETRQFLDRVDTEEAREALKYINECESCGNFEVFDPDKLLANLQQYYQAGD